MTTDDTKGMPHIVILESTRGITVQEFTGNDSMERAHESAQKSMMTDAYNKITVAVRVRQMTLMLAAPKRCKCDANPADEPHVCPYASDIHGDHTTLCTCCKDCARECADSI